MFTCSNCQVPTGPKVSPVLRNNIITDENWGIHIGTEVKLCPDCSGEPAKSQAEMNYSLVALGKSITGKGSHVKNCKRNPFDCDQCKYVMETMGKFPPQALNIVLTE